MQTGLELGGRYALEALLGAGGMGEVWRAVDRQLDRPVAVKVLRDRYADPRVAQRFQQEARIAARLQHSGIAVVHDVGSHDGQLFIVMELLRGQDLAAMLQRAPAGLPLATVVSVATQAAEALAAAHASGVIHRLQQQLQQVQGIQLFMEPVQNITVDDRVSRSQYQYSLEDPDINELGDWTHRFVARLRQLPDLENVATDEQPGGLAVYLRVDRVTASRLGIAPATIDNTLYDAFGQRQISTMYTQINQYHVILESDPRFQQDPDMLDHLYIQANASSGTSGAAAASSFSAIGSSSAGSNALTGSALYTPSANVLSAPANVLAARSVTSTSNQGAGSAGATSSTPSSAVPLSAFAHFQKTTEPLTIAHQGQFPAITVSFDLSPSGSLGSAIKAVNQVQQDLHMPASVQAGFQGTAQSFTASLSNEPLLILAALVAVYIVLGVLYESFIHPVTILSTLPSAGVGALLALILFGQGLNVVGLIGIILLIGIVTKNGIMMVDFALESERKRGKNSTDAIYEACLLRFRPILMTTLAAMLAGLPLALGSGIGSELRKPLGIAMVGGLLLSQALTLYTTPVIYIFFDRLSQRFAPKSAAPTGDSDPAPPAPQSPAAPA